MFAGFGLVAQPHSWVKDYTPINEPLTTARFSGLYDCWYSRRLTDATVVRTSAFFGSWDHRKFLTVALHALANGQSFTAATDTYIPPTYISDYVHDTLTRRAYALGLTVPLPLYSVLSSERGLLPQTASSTATSTISTRSGLVPNRILLPRVPHQ